MLPSAFLLLFVVLSTAPIAKIGDVQILEILQVACLGLAIPVFVYRGLTLPAGGVWRRYGGRYLLLLGLCFALALISVRLPFYTPPGVSILKRPLWISLARIFELFLGAYFMLAIATTLRRSPKLFRRALDGYMWAGALSAIVSVGGWGLVRAASISLFTIYGFDQRVRGFFNEGGPYGVFLVSVIVVLWLRSRVFGPLHPALRWPIVGLLIAALVLSQSKAALLAAVGLACVAMLFSGSRLQKIATVAACTLVLSIVLSLFGGKVLGYFYAYLNLEEAMASRPGDPSLIMGRIAAAVIVPRMVVAHPVLGIGVGNYSLMRNDPDYLENLPPVDEWDLAGMGLIGSAAEFGIPLTIFLLGVLLRPLAMCRRNRSPVIIAIAAGFQPLAFLLGVNLNFFYPWLVAAFVIALEESSNAWNAPA